MPTPFSRRNFFRLKLGDLAQVWRESQQPPESVPQVRPIRPPGARPAEPDFLKLCERCHHCSQACPHDAIQHLGPAAGSMEGTPVLKLETNPCHWCPTIDCIRACPSGALAFGPDETVLPVAKAKLDLELCLNQQGILCDTCASMCPSNVRAITMRNRQPQLDEARCVGCGLCAAFCEASPVALKINPLPMNLPKVGLNSNES